MTAFERAWALLKEEDDYGRSPRAQGGDGPDPNARWFAPNTFDADELRRYNRYLMDNFIDKLPEDAQGEVGFMLQFIEGAEKALRAGEEYFGFMTPEYAIGNINAILQKHGLTQGMGGMA